VLSPGRPTIVEWPTGLPTDGPAVVKADGTEEFWQKGVQLSNEPLNKPVVGILADTAS